MTSLVFLDLNFYLYLLFTFCHIIITGKHACVALGEWRTLSEFVFFVFSYVQPITQCYKQIKNTTRKTSVINPVTTENSDKFCYKCVGKQSCSTTAN